MVLLAYHPEITDTNDILSTSLDLSQDLFYMVIYDEYNWLTTIRHLEESAEIIAILNSYGHGQSYINT